MYTVIIINVVAIAFALRAGALRSDRWLRLSFLLIFLFLALRYDYGNDYLAYLKHFQEVDREELSPRLELAWQLLCLLFKPLGFFAMVAALAAFNCWAYYRFIKRYVPPAYYGFAVFLYVFDPYLMLVHSSAMRQSVAIALFLLAIEYIEKKDAVRYFACVGLASAFHSSALVLVPIFMLAWTRGRIREGAAVALFSLYLVALMFAGPWRPYVDQFVSTYAVRYDMYRGGTEVGTGLGLAYGAAALALVLLFAKQQAGERALLFKIAIISFFASVPLGMINTMAGRIGMYFTPVLMAVVPIVASNVKERKVGSFVLATYVFMTLYAFYGFFHSDVWSGAFGTYQTIMSAPEVY